MQGKLGTQETDLAQAAGELLRHHDENFDDRYKFFYDELAPMLELYRIRVGDTLTIKAFTKTGYSRSVNVKVYGTFEFSGLDKSPLAGAVNVMDMVSFRDLYGFLTTESSKEVEKLKKAAGRAGHQSRERRGRALRQAAARSRRRWPTPTPGHHSEELP